MELVVKIVVGRKNGDQQKEWRSVGQMRVLFQFWKGGAAEALKRLDHKTMGAWQVYNVDEKAKEVYSVDEKSKEFFNVDEKEVYHANKKTKEV